MIVYLLEYNHNYVSEMLVKLSYYINFVPALNVHI